MSDTQIISAMELSARLAIKQARIERIAFDSEDEKILATKQALKNARSNLYKARKVYKVAGIPADEKHLSKLQGKVSKAQKAYKRAIANSEDAPIFSELKAVQREHARARKAVRFAVSQSSNRLPDYTLALELSRLAAYRTL